MLSTPLAQENLGLAAEHGFYWRPNARSEWLVQDPEARFGWKDIVQPILQVRACMCAREGWVRGRGGGGGGGRGRWTRRRAGAAARRAPLPTAPVSLRLPCAVPAALHRVHRRLLHRGQGLCAGVALPRRRPRLWVVAGGCAGLMRCWCAQARVCVPGACGGLRDAASNLLPAACPEGSSLGGAGGVRRLVHRTPHVVHADGSLEGWRADVGTAGMVPTEVLPPCPCRPRSCWTTWKVCSATSPSRCGLQERWIRGSRDPCVCVLCVAARLPASV